MPESYSIRDYRAADIPALAALLTACDPEHPTTPAELAHSEALVDPRVTRRRYVVETDGRLLAQARYLQFSLMYDPDRYVLSLNVAPESRRRGLGTELMRRLEADLLPRRPRQFGFGLWEAQTAGRDWLLRLGYGQTMREIESRAQLAELPDAAWRPRLDALQAEGLRCERLDRLGDGEAWRRRVFALDMAVSEDIPMTGALTRPDFAIYEHLFFASPHYRRELCWLALDGEEPVALTWHAAGASPEELETCVSGVLRSHRGRGLASALKGLALDDARAAGIETVRTRNEENNAGMLAVNRKLGYRPCGAFLIMEKELET